MTGFLSYQYNSFCFFVYFDGKFCLSGIQISKKSAFRQQTAQQIIFLFLGFLRLEFCFVLSMRTKQNSFFLSKYFFVSLPLFSRFFSFFILLFSFLYRLYFYLCNLPIPVVFFFFKKEKRRLFFLLFSSYALFSI